LAPAAVPAWPAHEIDIDTRAGSEVLVTSIAR
jgi:hypothetical protein